MSPVAFTLGVLIVYILGLKLLSYYAHRHAQRTTSDYFLSGLLLGRLFHDHAPYLGALVLVAAFAAGISSVDSQLLASGSLLTRDLWQGGRDKPELEYQVARYATLGILLAVYLGCLGMENTPVMSLVLLGLSLGVCQLPTLIGTFFLPRCPEPAAFWSILAGTLVYLGRELFARDWLGSVQTISLCAGASWLVFVAGYLVAPTAARQPSLSAAAPKISC